MTSLTNRLILKILVDSYADAEDMMKDGSCNLFDFKHERKLKKLEIEISSMEQWRGSERSCVIYVTGGDLWSDLGNLEGLTRSRNQLYYFIPIEINYSRLMMPLALSRGIMLRPRIECVETQLSLFVSMEVYGSVYVLTNCSTASGEYLTILAV